MKKLIRYMSILMSAMILGGCAGTQKPPKQDPPQGDEPVLSGSLPEDSRIALDGEDVVLHAPAFDLRFAAGEGGYGLKLEREGTLAVSPEPAAVSIARNITALGAETEELSGAYTSYGTIEGDLAAQATLTSSAGTVLTVSDVFTFSGEGIDVHREVRVLACGEGDTGYSSRFALCSDEEGDFSACEYFIPGILYKDNTNMVEGAIGGSFRTKSIMVKETRTGLPMAMLRSKRTGATVSVVHRDPELYSPDERNYPAVTVADEFECGSVGLLRDPSPSVAYNYPNFETAGYVVNTGTTKRFFVLRKDAELSFDVGVYATRTDTFAEAMEKTYSENFSRQTLPSAEVDIAGLYNTSVSELKSLVQTQGGCSGLPFAAWVESGVPLAVSYEIGFVGMQTSLAYEMIRYGLLEGDAESAQKGEAILDFWTQAGITSSGVFRVWANANGSFTTTPCYLRMMTDGAEGILDACRLLRGKGDAREDWEETVSSYAEFLLRKQNPDGSWYRAYDLGGELFTADNPYGQVEERTTHADSKLNTPVPVRFLVRMYEFTGEEKYLDAAKKAGEFIIRNIVPSGKYVGGTPDNANTCDREAGIFALYCFNALYSATGEERYLTLARQAAVFTISWAYTFDFAVANPENLLAGKAFERGMSAGMSLIATGHSSIDTFMAYAYYEFFKLYVWTGDEFFYELSRFTENLSRRTTSCASDLGFGYGGFAIEATDISNFYFVTVEGKGVWLPWITNANVEPIANMQETFGVSRVEELKGESLEALKETLRSYGAGGGVRSEIE